MRPAILALAVMATLAMAKVERLDDGPAEGSLGESVGAGVYMKAMAKDGVTRMWTKAEKEPQGTDSYKTITNVEHHGKCRFACYGDKLCGGYSFTPATHICKLLSAPNFMLRPAENDMWHKTVAWDHTGADYEPDADVKKEQKNAKAGLKQIPKKKQQPGSKVQKKVGDEGHLPLLLGKIMDHELSKAQTETQEEGGDEATEKAESKGLVDAATEKKITAMRAKLYTEFYQRFAHEYEMRAEAFAHRRAFRIVKKRLKKHKTLHPDDKIKRDEKINMYRSARKYVDNRAVRKYQRSFAVRMRQWVSEKMYQVQETLKNQQDDAAKKDEEESLKQEKKNAGRSGEGEITMIW